MNYLKYLEKRNGLNYYLKKIKFILWNKIVYKTKKTHLYPCFYQSYWKYKFSKSNKKIDISQFYLAARPNPGAGIGHQLANWIAGYWWAKQLGVKFAHIPFSTYQWEEFLGFGEDEVTVEELVEKGYKKINIPLFNQFNPKEIELIKLIIQSYTSENIVFICEQDQGYMEQYGVMEDIQRKFYNAPSRIEDKLLYSSNFYNIAIHVRRGDITIGTQSKNSNLLMRWQENDYFVNVLSNVLKTLTTEKPIAIYLFSQGKESEYKDFEGFQNLQFCLNMSAKESFLHMIYADLLITSKSSFSYKPALLNKGIKVCPQNFWHSYPEDKNWILIDDKNISENSLDFKT